MTQTRTFAFVAIIALGGCASPDQFAQPIATFADATDKAATSFQALNKTGTDQLNAIEFDVALKSGKIAKAGCTVRADRCTLQVDDPDRGVRVPLVSTSLLPVSVQFMDAVQDYAIALNTLEKADATKDVQAAFENVTSAVAGIAAAVDAPAGAVAAILAKPLASAGSFGFGLYQNSLKLDALQRATFAADTVIQQAIPTLKKEADLVDLAYISHLENDYDAAHSAFRDNHTKENLQAEINAADSLDRALKAKSSKMFDTFADAHSKLTLALKDPKTDATDMIIAIGAFAEQAANIKDAVKQLSSLNKKS